MDLGGKVRSRRTELKMSQEDLARKMGYSSRTSINKIENGRPCSQKIIMRLAEALDTSVTFLMGWEDEIKKDPAGTAERHFEMIMDEDIMEIFEDFKKLDTKEKAIVKKFVRSMANEEI